MTGSTPETKPVVSFPAVLIDSPDRSRSDMCPGTMKLHNAQDGMIGRVRFPGGTITPQQWEDIAYLAEHLGDGSIHVTTRGNMQFRGVSDAEAFAKEVCARGMLPSATHDKIRNILASPLAAELLPLVDALDAALLNDATLQGLSGRTLFGLDDGRGDILSQHPDFGLFAEHELFRLVLAGLPTDRCVTRNEAVSALAFAAHQWQTQRGDCWRVHEHPTFVQDLLPQLDEAFATQRKDSQAALDLMNQNKNHRPIGWIENPDGTVSLGAGLRFGFFSAEVATLLGVIEHRVSITPWASLVIHDLTPDAADAVVRALAPRGLIFDQESPWLRVTACTGLPGCAKSHSETRMDAASLVSSDHVPTGLVHFSGCERRCGHPLGHHTEYVATGIGEYEVNPR